MALTTCKEGHKFSVRKHGNNCPYCGLPPHRTKDDEDASGGVSDIFLEQLDKSKCVVGWIVCTEGASKGKDYRILPEKNFIGRSPRMDIRIFGDSKIAEYNHAVVMYDPEDRCTTVLPGDAKGIVYKKGFGDEQWKRVEKPEILKAGEFLKIGDSEFIFVPLCGVNEGFKFHWAKG